MRRNLLSVLALFAITSALPAQVFVPGNLVVLRIGDGVGTLSSASAPVFIDQYTTGGVIVGSPLAIDPLMFSNAGTSTSEGFLSQSTNGQFVTFATYNAPAGTAAIAGTPSTTFQRAVIRIDSAATVGSTLLGTTAYSGSNPRSAITTDGTNIWTAGTASSGANGGVHFTTFGSGTTSGQLSSTPTNTRVINIINNQLYVSSASGTFQGVSTVGTGLPTTPGQTTTLLPGFPTVSGPSTYQYAGFDSPTNPNSFNGIDTIYVADDRTANGTGGLQRWTYDGSVWSNSGTITPPDSAGTGFVGLRGLTASINGSNVTLFGTTTETTGNRLVSISDALSGLGGTFGTFSTLATAPANTVFRGLAFAPVPVPEPSSILCVGLGTLALGRWVRRRRAK